MTEDVPSNDELLVAFLPHWLGSSLRQDSVGGDEPRGVRRFVTFIEHPHCRAQ
jgi:hypothetical protein